jgi:hypothetical protein
MSKETPKEDIKDLLPLVLQLTNSEQVMISPFPPHHVFREKMLY